MPGERRGGAAPHDNRTVPPRELDPARSKSVEAVEQEVDEIVAARERARHRSDSPMREDEDIRKP